MLISITSFLLILSTLSTIQSACVPATSGAASGKGGGGGGGGGKCSSYLLINARGTMEIPATQSMAYRLVNSKIMSQVSGGKVYNVNYAASIMQNSGGGTADIVRKIKSTHASEPNTCFFLEGYSQGAAAVMFALPKLLDYYDSIRGVSVVGNPLAGVQAMMGGSAEHTKFKCKTLEICAMADPVCLVPKNGGGPMSHVDYIFNPADHSKIAKFAVEALTTGIRACGGAGGGGGASSLLPGGGGGAGGLLSSVMGMATGGKSSGSGGMASGLAKSALKQVPVVGSFADMIPGLKRSQRRSLEEFKTVDSLRRRMVELEQEWKENQVQRSNLSKRHLLRRQYRKRQLQQRQVEIEQDMVELMKRLQLPSISSLIGIGGKSKDGSKGGGGGGIESKVINMALGEIPGGSMIAGFLPGGGGSGGGSSGGGGGGGMESKLINMALGEIPGGSMIAGFLPGGGAGGDSGGGETCPTA